MRTVCDTTPDVPRLVLSDPDGKIFSHPYLKMAGRSGDRIVVPPLSELVPLPRGSQLFTMPGRIPVGWDGDSAAFVPSEKVKIGRKERACTAVAAFLPPGYVRSLLPATSKGSGGPVLPLWAYSSVGWKKGRFWATGIFLDPNPHWNPRYFQNDRRLKTQIDLFSKSQPENRLLRQLTRCAVEYRCFAAKNVFFRRWECPLPTSPTCNANCIGCISLQPSECCPASQERISFVPAVDEVVGVALPHLERSQGGHRQFRAGLRRGAADAVAALEEID